MTVLKAENISHTYMQGTRPDEVLKNIDLEFERGRMYALQGKSGSGKTTLLNILCGILPPSGGRAIMCGQDLYALNDSALSVFRGEHAGIIPQGQSAVSTLTVLENVMLPAAISGRGADVEERARQLLDMLQILDLAGVMPAELSGGEVRRMAVARALIRDPDIIFADEPTSDLDAENTAAVFRVLKDAAGSGKAVFVVSHENSISEYADVIYHMEEGRLSGVNP